MAAQESRKSLEEIRTEIDDVDRQLLALLNRRAMLSKEVGELKAHADASVFKPDREAILLDTLERENQGPLPNAHLRAIWREILSSSRALQRPQNIAYLGPEGTFSYFAGMDYLGHSVDFHPCRDIGQIFEAVTDGRCDLGVVPLENSLQGTVGVSFDLFLKHNVTIEAELYSRISHALLSKAHDLAQIKKVYSHPQALAQCGGWLRTRLPDALLIPVESTAAAAAKASQEPETAAIANVRLAEKRGLEILARGIEDERGNWTRFVIIAPGRPQSPVRSHALDVKEGGTKASLLFTLLDKPGTLATVLDLLARHGINMRKLESRPMSGQPWRYVFFCDVEGDINAATHGSLLEELEGSCSSFRVLGCYSAGPQFERDISGKEG